jgi:DNA-binding GntR family transcriptional regulator
MNVQPDVPECLAARPAAYVQRVVDHGARLPVYLQLADVLEARIRAGELPAGRTIPSEKTLMQEFGLSRGSVRKAVAVLRERRLVDTVPQRGTFVI